jgi:hypothetical protein
MVIDARTCLSWAGFCHTYVGVSARRINQLLDVGDDKPVRTEEEKAIVRAEREAERYRNAGKNGQGRDNKIDMRAAANAFYADRYKSVIGLFCNAPKDATPEQAFRTMRAEAQNEYENLDATIAKQIKIPKLVTEPTRTREDQEIRRIAVKMCELLLIISMGKD